ncbi:MAG: phosphodiester glycosidase family protein [Phycisphaeraceae bacterium]
MADQPTQTQTTVTHQPPPQAGPSFYRLAAVIFCLIAIGWTTFLAVQHAWWLLAVGMPPLGLAIALALPRGPRRWSRKIACAGLVLVSLPPLALWAYQAAMLYSPRPEPAQQMLFQGVQYIREVVDVPQPAVVHIVKIDLTAEGVEVLVTPPDFPDEELAFKARTTSAFLREFDLQIAINAGHFHPFRKTPIWEFYPLPGDPVGVLGASVSRGQVYAEPRRHFPMLDVSVDGRAVIAEHPPEPFYNAVTGIKRFRADAQPHRPARPEDARARSAVYLDETGSTLFLVAVDGGQAPYSVGIDRPALSRIMLKHGAYEGMALDAGGSSTLVMQGTSGRPSKLNRPVNLVPRLERPVGTHIGIYAKPLNPEPR